MMIIN